MGRITDFTVRGPPLIELWSRWHRIFMAIGVLVILAGIGKFGFEQYLTGEEEQRRQAAETVAKRLAHDLGQALKRELAGLSQSVNEAELAEVLRRGDPRAVAAKEASLARQQAQILKARLLKLGFDQVDYTAQPPLGYAVLEMLHRSESTGKAPPPEAHLFGRDEQYLAILRRVSDDSGNLAGHLLFWVDVSLLDKAVAGIPLSMGYGELQQPLAQGQSVVLATRGNKGMRRGVPLSLKVPGTSWTFAFWDGSGQSVDAVDVDGLLLWVAAGGGALLLGLVPVLLAWQRSKVTPTPPPLSEPSGVNTQGLGNGKVLSERVPRAGGVVGINPPSETAEPHFPALDGIEVGKDVNDQTPTKVELPASIFRAYDVRGVVGKTLTAEIVHGIGRAIGSEAHDRGQETIVVGCDGRLSGPELRESLVEGLRATGRDVIDVGRVPTPVLYFATYYLNTGSGVMVTGSHNPPEYNGLKIMLGGQTLFGEAISGLRIRTEAGEFHSGMGDLKTMDVVDAYVRRIAEDIPVALGNAFKVVLDCGNAVAGEVAPKLYRALGHEVIELHCEVDGNFPHHHPDPSQPENLKELVQAVQEYEADVGFAFDGDGDRIGVVDGKGNVLWPDRQMMLYAKNVLSRYPGAGIIYDVKCTNRLGAVIEKHGGKPLMWKSGHSFMKHKLEETGALLAGELSGHIFFKDRWYGFDDALYTAARMLEILLGFNQPPHEIFAKLPGGVNTPELRVDLQENEHQRLVDHLLQGSPFSDAKLTTIDGLRADYPDGWGLVRASNTTPSLVLRFEADNEQALKRIQEEFKGVLLDLEPRLSLPF